MADEIIKVLILEDNDAHAEVIRRSLSSSPEIGDVEIIAAIKQFPYAVTNFQPDIILADLRLGDGTALDVLSNEYPMVVMTSQGDENIAVQVMKAGALDYVVKSKEMFQSLARILVRCFNQWQLVRQVKRTELTLQENEGLLRSMIDASPGGVALTADRIFKRVNNRLVLMTGYSVEELIGKTTEFLYPSSAEYVRVGQVLYDILREKGSGQVESQWVRKDGTIMDVLMCASLLNPGDWSMGVTSIVLDITDRIQAERLREEEKERLLVTLRSIGDGVITTDLEGEVTILNKIAEQLTGWKLEESVGKHICEIFSVFNEKTKTPIENPVAQVIRSSQSTEVREQTVLINREGLEINISDSAAPILDRTGKVIGVVLVFRDITEERKLFDTMQRSQKLDSLAVLAGGIAHDFNNLLGGMFCYLDLALSHGNMDTSAKNYLEKAMQVYSRAKDLTQQLLTFSKGGLPILSVGSVSRILKESVMFALSGSNVSADFQIVDDLWLCEFDENQIGQVIDNIVINAQQAMPLGGTILVSAANIVVENNKALDLKDGNYIRLTVRDKGVGIPKDVLPRIFDPFFSTKQKGTGLGLATTYSIVRKHDGIIDIKSEASKGTEVNVYLPAAANKAVAETQRKKLEHRGSGFILVMDDEDFIRDIVTKLLEGMGYTPIVSKDGAEAIRLCKENLESGKEIKVAILDLTIPGGLGGQEILPELRQLDPRMKIIASSGYSNDPVMAKPSEYNFDARLQKPYRASDLAEVMAKICEDG